MTKRQDPRGPESSNYQSIKRLMTEVIDLVKPFPL